MLADIDECAEGLDSCEQICMNTNGSYACSCQSCYYLGSDGFSCNGKCHTKTHLYLSTSISLCRC